jgi:hypothetical protein
MVNYKITCERCQEPATITAEGGKFCKKCWLLNRKEKRKKKNTELLNNCFSYKTKTKVTKREAQIINEIMTEINDQKVYK